MTSAQGTRVNRRYNLLIIRCACSACCCCSFTSSCSSSSYSCSSICCCHPCTVLHLFGLPDQPQQLAGPPNATHPIPNPKASLKFAEKLCQTSRDREEELHRESRCWQEVRDGERGAQHELQKILQRHDSTLANVADAANTASVASPFYVAIFMSCWPENGD